MAREPNWGELELSGARNSMVNPTTTRPRGDGLSLRQGRNQPADWENEVGDRVDKDRERLQAHLERELTRRSSSSSHCLSKYVYVVEGKFYFTLAADTVHNRPELTWACETEAQVLAEVEEYLRTH